MFFCHAMPTQSRTEGAGVGVVGGPCLYLEPKGPLFFDTSQKKAQRIRVGDVL